jgi:hypothetical protein
VRHAPPNWGPIDALRDIDRLLRVSEALDEFGQNWKALAAGATTLPTIVMPSVMISAPNTLGFGNCGYLRERVDVAAWVGVLNISRCPVGGTLS